MNGIDTEPVNTCELSCISYCVQTVAPYELCELSFLLE